MPHTVLSIDTMVYALSTFVSIPSVSSDLSHREDCRQAAIWLKKCLHQLGAESTLVRDIIINIHSLNDVMFSSYLLVSLEIPLYWVLFVEVKESIASPGYFFMGQCERYLLQLGFTKITRHYDVISAPMEGWKSNPFKADGRNGYLYGRGVSDDKGPIIVVACAAAELLRRRALGVDLIFLIEGEEEVGSTGFMDAVRKHKVPFIFRYSFDFCLHPAQAQIGHVDAILLRFALLFEVGLFVSSHLIVTPRG